MPHPYLSRLRHPLLSRRWEPPRRDRPERAKHCWHHGRDATASTSSQRPDAVSPRHPHALLHDTLAPGPRRWHHRIGRHARPLDGYPGWGLAAVRHVGNLKHGRFPLRELLTTSWASADYSILTWGPPARMVRTCLFPNWVPVYLTYKNPTELAVILKNGDLAGSWPMHLNQSDGNPMNIDQNPMFWMDPRGGQWGTQGVAGDWNSRGPLSPETAHTPSLAFVPYLVTGDRYYVDEMKDWAAWGLANGNPGYRGGTKPGFVVAVACSGTSPSLAVTQHRGCRCLSSR